jgi:hypothetical protein
MIFSRIKTWGLAIAAGAMGVLLVIVKILTAQNSRLRHRAENAEAKAKRAVIIQQADIDIEKAHRRIRKEREKQIEETGDSEYWRDPNKLFKRPDDS